MRGGSAENSTKRTSEVTPHTEHVRELGVEIREVVKQMSLQGGVLKLSSLPQQRTVVVLPCASSLMTRASFDHLECGTLCS